MKAKEFQERMASLEGSLSRLEGDLAALQRQYEEKALELGTLKDLRRRLASYRLPDARPVTWTGVCRAQGWSPRSGDGHRTVKRHDPALHALLHVCVFDAFCSLERVSYVP